MTWKFVATDPLSLIRNPLPKLMILALLILDRDQHHALALASSMTLARIPSDDGGAGASFSCADAIPNRETIPQAASAIATLGGGAGRSPDRVARRNGGPHMHFVRIHRDYLFRGWGETRHSASGS